MTAVDDDDRTAGAGRLDACPEVNGHGGQGQDLSGGPSIGGMTELSSLTRGECLRLLRGDNVGRVVFTDSAMPAAQPVNYVLAGEEVLFRTDPGDRLAACTRGAIVAFEADDIDRRSHTGWSVLGIGPAYEITSRERLAQLAGRLPTSSAAIVDAGHTFAIPLQVLTGRRLAVAGRVSESAAIPS